MKTLITGSHEFCEQRDGADHMDERRALAFALDFVQPSEVVIGSTDKGTARWARIWADKRGVTVTVAGDFKAALALKPEYAVCFGIGADHCRKHGIDVYEVSVG